MAHGVRWRDELEQPAGAGSRGVLGAVAVS
jgi:hypothetical protein